MQNLAISTPVISSDPEPIIGSLEQITDGDKDSRDGSWIELQDGLQWIQIDLGGSHEIWGIVLWQCPKEHWSYKDVVVQVADDEQFRVNARTLFNNDDDNSAALGRGTDPRYVESERGKFIPGGKVRARYVRCYSAPGLRDEQVRYTEVAVFGVPAGAERPVAATQRARELVPLKRRLPAPYGYGLVPHKRDRELDARTERPVKGVQQLMVPSGTKNLALYRPATGSSEPHIGQFSRVTDGLNGPQEEVSVVLQRGVQWVQVDLGKPTEIWAVAWFLEPWTGRPMVVVQLSDDPQFEKGVTTAFNNDFRDLAGRGKGRDLLYLGTFMGKAVSVPGIRARYVRLYHAGSDAGPGKWVSELEVYGLEGDGKGPTTTPHE